jgi:hypothetical protein
MIDVDVRKATISNYYCDNKYCKHLSENVWQPNLVANPVDYCIKAGDYCIKAGDYCIKAGDYCIKVGTVCAFIEGKVFCNGCIDEVYQLIKSKLDRKLWSFQ